MNKFLSIIVLASVFVMCNITLLIKGYSYIGYSATISLFVGVILFKFKHSRFSFALWSSAFILSLSNILVEITFKFKFLEFADPTRVDDFSYIGIVYLVISLITGLIWSRKKKTRIDS